MRKSIIIPAVVCLAMMAELASAISVYSGTDPDATLYVGVRDRYFHAGTADKELYIGTGDMATIEFRSQVDVAWRALNTFSITYDGNVLAASVSNGTNIFTGSYVFDWAENTPNPLNYFQIDQVSREAGTTASFLNLMLNGESLGDFTGDGWNSSYFYTSNLQNGFTITGQIALSGTFSTSREDSKLQISMGYSPDAPLPSVPEPITYLTVLVSVAGIGRYVMKYRVKLNANQN